MEGTWTSSVSRSSAVRQRPKPRNKSSLFRRFNSLFGRIKFFVRAENIPVRRPQGIVLQHTELAKRKIAPSGQIGSISAKVAVIFSVYETRLAARRSA